jgi:hypothetical protein
MGGHERWFVALTVKNSGQKKIHPDWGGWNAVD